MTYAQKQWAVSLAPLVLGGICNYLFLLLPIIMWPVNLGFPFLWGYLCYRTADRSMKLPGQILRLCLTGAVMLILGLYQELGRGAYFSGFLGLAPQFYFLPSLSLFGRFAAPFLDVISAGRIYPVEYAGFLLICAGAVRWKTRKNQA